MMNQARNMIHDMINMAVVTARITIDDIRHIEPAPIVVKYTAPITDELEALRFLAANGGINLNGFGQARVTEQPFRRLISRRLVEVKEHTWSNGDQVFVEVSRKGRLRLAGAI